MSESNREYLLKKAYKEPVSPEEFYGANERLDKPTQRVEYGERGNVHISTEEYNIDFEYEPVPESSYPDIVEILEEQQQGHSHRWGNLAPNTWKEVRELSLCTGDQEEKFGLDSLVPNGYRIFYNPNENSGGLAVSEKKTLYMTGDIARPSTLLVFLHEAGHAWDHQKRSVDYEKLRGDSNATDAEKLRAERIANAFVYRVLNRFYRNGKHAKDAIILLRHIALEHRKADIRSRFVLERSLAHDARDFEDEMRWDQEHEDQEYFNEWKQTDDFKKWLDEKGYAGKDEHELFKLWRNEVMEKEE